MLLKTESKRLIGPCWELECFLQTNLVEYSPRRLPLILKMRWQIKQKAILFLCLIKFKFFPLVSLFQLYLSSITIYINTYPNVNVRQLQYKIMHQLLESSIKMEQLGQEFEPQIPIFLLTTF